MMTRLVAFLPAFQIMLSLNMLAHSCETLNTIGTTNCHLFFSSFTIDLLVFGGCSTHFPAKSRYGAKYGPALLSQQLRR
jgi:hypothetical protein